jgi:hypothetical protein
MSQKEEITETGIPFLTEYFTAIKNSEASRLAHLWSILTVAGAALRGRTWIQFGESRIHGSMYTILWGDPASKKSTAASLALGLLRDSGYGTHKFVPEHLGTRWLTANFRKFQDLDVQDTTVPEEFRLPEYVHDVVVAPDELINFFGTAPGNVKSVYAMTALWETKSTTIPGDKESGSEAYLVTNPAVTLLGGITSEAYERVLGQLAEDSGLISRVNLVVCQRSSKRIAMPQPMPFPTRVKLCDHLKKMQSPTDLPAGEVTITASAMAMLEKLYRVDDPVEFSIRLRAYKARRYTHLLKLCVIFAGMAMSKSITTTIVAQANTILHFTEQLLPAALTERSSASSSQAEKAIITALTHHLGRPLDIATLERIAYPYLPVLTDLAAIIHKLSQVGRIKAYQPANRASSAVNMYYIPKQDTSVFGEEFIDETLRTFLWQDFSK